MKHKNSAVRKMAYDFEDAKHSKTKSGKIARKTIKKASSKISRRLGKIYE